VQTKLENGTVCIRPPALLMNLKLIMTENEADIISAINPDALAYYQAMMELLTGVDIRPKSMMYVVFQDDNQKEIIFPIGS